MITTKRAYPGERRNGIWKGRITRIIVNGETWEVPRGFGASYLRCVRSLTNSKASLEADRDILELVGYTASLETIKGWPLRKRVEAGVYAASVHMRASDNPTPVPPRPDWMGEPWNGPDSPVHLKDTVWGGPSPTVLT